MLGVAALAGALLSVAAVSAPANAASIAQCNGVAEDGAGVECDVTITNEWDMATATGSSTIVTRVCVGAANVDFGPGDCTVITEENLADVTTTVEQCNGTANGGGSTLRCTVSVTNTIIGTGTTGAPSVNQCNGSFDSLDPLPAPSLCDPVQATTDAAITQCNNSINGGTNVSMQCTVGVSTVSTAMPISVDQCNGSVNGGGALVECSTSISTVFVAAGDGSGGDGSGGGGTVADDDATARGALAATGAGDQPIALVAVVSLLLGALLLARSRALGRRQADRV